MKYLFICAILFLSGCTFNQKQSMAKNQKVTKKPIRQKRYLTASDMARGVVLSQNFDKKTKLWKYDLKVIDITSDKNMNISFFYEKKKYKIGDLVYVIFKKDNQNLAKEIYLGRKINKKTKKVASIPRKKYKRTKAKQKISVPKSETIELN